jgi:nitrogen fixation NifU-like protein
MMSDAVKGKTVQEVRDLTSTFKAMMSIHEHEIGGDGSESTAGGVEGSADGADGDLDLGDLEALRGVVKFPVRIKCATLGWNTLSQALEELASAG